MSGISMHATSMTQYNKVFSVNGTNSFGDKNEMKILKAIIIQPIYRNAYKIVI